MARSNFASGSLMSLLVHSAVAGVGFSMGRDVYKKTRDNFLYIVLAVIALAGTAYGVWNMTRGHGRGLLGTIFITILMNVVLIAVSFSLFMFAVVMIGGGHKQVAQSLVMGGIGAQGVLGLGGLVFGLAQRPKRLEAMKVDAHNEDFLINNGFRDVGGRDDTMLDPDGNELVLDDFRKDAVVFKVKGRRSVRAKILLDTTGRMISYMPT